MISKFPTSIQKELAASNIEINIVSGVGQCKSEINEYVYQRIPAGQKERKEQREYKD